MANLTTHLKTLQKIPRRVHHPLQHTLHKAYRISKKTLFYVKEYGPHTHVAKTIIRESLKILLFSSILSSLGGLALEKIKTIFVSIIPLTILLPTLNDMIGDFGTVISARVSTMLHAGQIKSGDYHDRDLKYLFYQVLIISFVTGLVSAVLAIAIATATSGNFDGTVALKVCAITILDIAILIHLLTLTTTAAAFHYFKKGEDPNNFLIPISTSIADFGNMIILAFLVMWFF